MVTISQIGFNIGYCLKKSWKYANFQTIRSNHVKDKKLKPEFEDLYLVMLLPISLSFYGRYWACYVIFQAKKTLFAVNIGPIMCTKGLNQPLFTQAGARILPLRWGYIPTKNTLMNTKCDTLQDPFCKKIVLCWRILLMHWSLML